MRAMVLRRCGEPLELAEIPRPTPGPGQLLVQVEACGVCRTDQHIADGELAEPPRLPLVLGHEVVGRIVELAPQVEEFTIGQRVGIPWLGSTCGRCWFCVHEQENLCDNSVFTGYTRDGGYAQFAVADARYCFALPVHLDAVHAAPLLCAGLIGFRSYRFVGEHAQRIGFYGFGASAHILAQLAVAQGREIFAFVRPGDEQGRRFALELGCVWAGFSDEPPPCALDGAIIFAPVGALVPAALRAVRKGGVVVCGGIHMSPIPSFPYRDLWHERVIRSVANLTRSDGLDFFKAIENVAIHTHVRPYPLEQANDALDALRHGQLTGAAVLVMP
ncbi:MAG: zinc-dependent alcohol dehydrogenase family protein [Candidatus Sumerlaeaceae bacterium]